MTRLTPARTTAGHHHRRRGPMDQPVHGRPADSTSSGTPTSATTSGRESHHRGGPVVAAPRPSPTRWRTGPAACAGRPGRRRLVASSSVEGWSRAATTTTSGRSTSQPKRCEVLDDGLGVEPARSIRTSRRKSPRYFASTACTAMDFVIASAKTVAARSSTCEVAVRDGAVAADEHQAAVVGLAGEHRRHRHRNTSPAWCSPERTARTGTGPDSTKRSSSASSSSRSPAAASTRPSVVVTTMSPSMLGVQRLGELVQAAPVEDHGDQAAVHGVGPLPGRVDWRVMTSVRTAFSRSSKAASSSSSSTGKPSRSASAACGGQLVEVAAQLDPERRDSGGIERRRPARPARPGRRATGSRS